jgi:hypothetical protein
MATNGVLYDGLAILGNGAILTGLVLAAIGVFVIERRFMAAACLRRRGGCPHLLRLHARARRRHRGDADGGLLLRARGRLLYLADRRAMAEGPAAAPAPIAAE